MYTTAEIRTPAEYDPVDRRTVSITAIAFVIAIGAGLAAQLLVALIGLVTNAAFYGRIATTFVSPMGGHRSPLALLLIPIAGALIVGLMARYGSAAIRGHGIPEVMEKVLFGESRIPARVLVLKPLSAAIAIGTGGPFGAEGPIIATGGALGSLVGQIFKTTPAERKTLLAAGAAAGMAATFGSPVAAVLLAVELLLFELRARSLIPVALAAAAATAVRIALVGTAPAFQASDFLPANATSLACYAAVGALVKRSPVVVTGDTSLRQALDLMVRARVGRLVVVERTDLKVPVGILTRSDLLGAHAAEHGQAGVKRPSVVVVATPRAEVAARG
jgi:CIC family chloride channel protein